MDMNVIWEISFLSELPLWLEGTIRTVNPLSLQIMRIGRRQHNAQHMTSFLQKCAKIICCWNCNVNLPPIMLLLIFQWHTRVYKETFNVYNNKIAKKKTTTKTKRKIKQNKMK